MDELERKRQLLEKKKKLLELKMKAQQTEPQKDGFPGAKYIEPALTLGSGIVGTMIGGLSSIQPSLIFSDPKKGEQNLRQIQRMMTYQPRTQEGQQGLQSFGDAINTKLPLVDMSVPEMFNATEDAFTRSGAQTFDTVGLPPALGAAAGSIMPELLTLPLGGPVTRRTLLNRQQLGYPKVDPLRAKMGYDIQPAQGLPAPSITQPSQLSPWQLPKKKAIGQKLIEQQKHGGDDMRLSRYKVSDSGRTVNDAAWNKYADDAINAGYDPGYVSALKNTSRADKDTMLKMVDDMETAIFDKKKALRVTPRAKVGDALQQQVQYLDKLRTDAGSQLDNVAKSLSGQIAEFTPAIDSFTKKLNDMGIKIRSDLTPDFKYSDIEGLDSAEKAVARIIKRLGMDTPDSVPTAHDMHRLKTYIDNNVSYGKTGDGMLGQVERVIKELRHDVDNILDTNFPEYNRINTQYSDALDGLNTIQSAVGKKLDFGSKYANKAIGRELRKITSNYRSSDEILEAMDTIQNVAKKYGGTFDNDIDSLVMFNNMIEDAFEPILGNSFRGQIGRANADAARYAADAARGNKTLLGLGADTVSYIGKKVIKPNKTKEIEAQLKAIRELLKQ